MYDIRPSHVFVHRRVYANPQAVARLERMLRALGDPPVMEVDAGDTEKVLKLAGPPAGAAPAGVPVRMGFERRAADPALLFNTFVWDAPPPPPLNEGEYQDPATRRIRRLMAGAGEDFAYSRRDELISGGVRYVCQGGWGIHSLTGCVHKCNYCYEGYVVNIMLDLEDFAENVYQTTLRRPHQKLYRHDMYSDAICFEPEYGSSAILSEMFARTGDKYLLYYTKSDNVDHLLDLPHKSNAIFYLSLATETVCRVIERDTPSMARRIEALRRCQQAGYRVRVGFSPIIPLRDWRAEASECLEQLFAAVRPETVRLWVLSMMSASNAEALIGAERLDPRLLQSIRENRDPNPKEMFDQPFPRAARAEVYAHYLDEIRRISPDTPVTLCSERRELWDMLADRLSVSPDELYCCCGCTSAERHVT
ncbi:MAG TPA: hypothetical protein VNA25_28225 [Phycisphaerae bacterium]|nr:hypothetical protein [Phycisphaerae bacterium]HUT61743.1 hypothetical protein [Phycisphaerae bacterium]